MMYAQNENINKEMENLKKKTDFWHQDAIIGMLSRVNSFASTLF